MDTNSLNVRQNAGFVLIELAVVIIVLAILAVIALPKFIDIQQDAHIQM